MVSLLFLISVLTATSGEAGCRLIRLIADVLSVLVVTQGISVRQLLTQNHTTAASAYAAQLMQPAQHLLSWPMYHKWMLY